MEQASVATQPKVSRRMRWIALLCAAILSVLLAGAVHFGFLGENFRILDEGRCYRSAQPSAARLNEHIQTLQLKCIVNLRGFCKDTWHQQEEQVCRDAHVELVDVKIDPERLPRPDVAATLAKQFQNGPYPMLMHCRNGADRTGLAAVLYELIANRKSYEVAAQELSWTRGHFNTSKSDSSERFFELWLKTGGNKSISDWIEQDYATIYQAVGPYGSFAAFQNKQNTTDSRHN